MRRIKLFLLILNVLVALSARSSDTLVFHHVTEKLSQNTVSKIFQDQDGFLWFATRFGLNKYDGRYFQQYFGDMTDTTALSNSRIHDVVQDDKGNFWLATDMGLNYYDRKTGQFQRYLHDPQNPNSLASNLTTALYLDHLGNLWVASESDGITRYDIDAGRYSRFRHNQDDPYSLSNNHVTTMLEDTQGNLWIGTWGGGLNLYDNNTRRFITYDLHDSQIKNAPRVLLNDEEGLWVGSNEGLFFLSYSQEGRYEIEQIELPAYPALSSTLAEATILSLMKDQAGNLWIGSENKGLFILSKDRRRIQHYFYSGEEENSISSNSIWSLFLDRSGIIWIGTYDNGLDKMDPLRTKINHISDNPSRSNSVSYNIVSSFVEEPDRGLWIGTDGGGLNFLDYQTNRIRYFNEGNQPNGLLGNAVLSLLVDSDENLWVASWEGGVSIKRKGQQRFEHIDYDPNDPNSLLGSDAFYLYEDSRGNVWVSIFRSGLNIYDKNKNLLATFKTNPKDDLAVSNHKVRCLLESEPGVFWLGTEGDGIDKITVDDDYRITSKANFKSIPGKAAGLSHNVISHIHQSSDGKFWITTFGGGVNVLDAEGNVLRKISTENGLSSNVVLSIEEDGEGNMWVGTGRGLCRIDKGFQVRQFDGNEGLGNAEFAKSSSYINSDGELFFGSNQGYYRFNPQDILHNNTVPPVILTGFKVAGREDLDFTGGALLSDIFTENEIRLKHNENDFTFHFAVLNYSQPKKNKYAYKLDGYDDDWLTSDDGYDIHYTNVLPGTYTFRVKGANNDGVWNEEGARIKLIVARPWYFSNLAITVYLLAFLFLLLWFRRDIINRERLKSNLEMEHLELTKMQEISKLKSRFFANISHEFRTPLTLIIGPLKSMLNGTYKGDAKGQYRMMARNAERLLRLINQILDLSRLESGSIQLQASKRDIVKFLKPTAHAFTSYAEKQFIDYKCIFPNNPVEVYFEGDKLEKIVINLLSNAFKYTQEFGKIKFTVQENQHEVLLKVEDTGVGIAEDQLDFIFDRFYQIDNSQKKGSGIGLALTKELVDLHKGSIEVSSKLKEGTTFTVRLAKGHAHLSPEEIVSSETDTAQQFEEDFRELEMIKSSIPMDRISEGSTIVMDELPVVLVVEDNDDMRMFISEYLVTNYKIIEANNGKEALTIAHETIPDVIVSDIIMPEMNGYDLCRKIKEDERTSHVPVILLTAKASGESTERGFELGADYYVTKPFNPKLLELRIKNILKTREQLRHQLLTINDNQMEPRDLKIASKDQEFLKKAIKIVEENLSNSDFGVDDLYRELGLSRTQLYRKLKGLVGQSANEFIRSFRLKRAAQLLKQQELTISEITYQVGFNDLQYFRYCFKKQFGSNPSEYAQAIQ